MTLPKTCRKCGERERMYGNFMCPTCHPDTTANSYSGRFASDEPEYQ